MAPTAAEAGAVARADESAPPSAIVPLQREHLARMPPGGMRSGSTRYTLRH
jgi:hypothetical protein